MEDTLRPRRTQLLGTQHTHNLQDTHNNHPNLASNSGVRQKPFIDYKFDFDFSLFFCGRHTSNFYTTYLQ